MRRCADMMRRAPLVLGLIGLPLSASAQVVVEYYHLDAIGNVLAVTDQNGVSLEQHDYDAFGQEVSPQAGNQPKRFTGKERDLETGWDYFGARYYGSRLGRFTTNDPVYVWKENILDPQRWNRYVYSRNNPLRYVDPDGRVIRFAENVSDSFKSEYQTARNYLGVSGADSVLRQLEEMKEVVTLRESTSLKAGDATFFDPSDKSISWNPFASLQLTTGGAHTPALGLLHEADHAVQAITKPDQYKRDMENDGSTFKNAEERRVILGSEAAAARAKGEPVRSDHYGEYKSVPHSDERPQSGAMPPGTPE
jgi:RHS repeat-associated protein